MSPDPNVFNTPNLVATNTVTTSVSGCVVPQSWYVDYSASRKMDRRFWQFVYDRLMQAADWVYDNKL